MLFTRRGDIIMKTNKKIVMAASFLLGATMFVTTAFADIASKTGYDLLKDSVKFTAKSMSDKMQSYTIESVFTVKDNDKVLMSESSLEKVDNTKKAVESHSAVEEYNGKNNRSYFSYRDSSSSIWYDQGTDTYYVTEYSKDYDFKPSSNPFEDSHAKDLEKIFDALVGDLKNYVVVEEKSNGSKELSGNLNEGQIPALVNAVTSFLLKQNTSNVLISPDGKTSSATLEDVYVKSVSGKAFVNEDGILESVLATGVLSGKDSNGVTHDITAEALVKVYDIDSTKVSKPNLEGKNVQKSTARDLGGPEITARYVGKYSNNIVIVENDTFVKIGERILEIAHIDDKNVSGHYYEVYDENYADYAAKALDFRFDAEITDPYSAQFTYTDPSGNEQSGNIHFDPTPGKLYFYFTNGRSSLDYDGNFSRVFD
jgi:hypothetical protein